MRPFFLLVLALTLPAFAGCPNDDLVTDDDTTGWPPSDDDDAGDDDGADDDTSPWEDPVELLDTYGGSSFAELLEVEIWAERIAFCSGVQGLNLWDATDPADLVLLDRTGFSAGSPAYPRCQHVAVDADGARLYVSSHADMIQPQSFIAVFDAGDATQLVEVGTVVRDEQVEGLTVAGDLLLVAAHDAGLLVFERGSGGTLTLRDQVPGLGNAWTVRAQGQRAYVTDGNGGLTVLDISVPQDVQLIRSLELPGAAKGLVLDGDRAYVALGLVGVALLSLAAPDDPQLIEIEDTPGSALALAYGAAPQGLFVADWNDIRIYDASDRDDLRLIGREPLPLTSSTDSRTLGIAARDDVFFSSNWTEMVSYRYHPGREAPDLVITPSPLIVADADSGEESIGVLDLANHGTKPLKLIGVETDPSGVLSPGSLPESFEPGAEATLLITFAPEDASVFLGAITVDSDDPDQPSQSISVRANGGGLGIGDALPPMSFVGLDGTVYNAGELLGAVVLLDYFATF